MEPRSAHLARFSTPQAAWVGAALTVALAASALRPPPCAPSLRWLAPGRLGVCREPPPTHPLWPWRRGHGAPFASERALLRPLEVGDELGPGRVFQIAHHFEARLMVGVHVDGRAVWLQVTRAAGGEVPPRAVAGPFAVTIEPGAEGVDDSDRDALARALADVLRRNAHAPVPHEMQPLRRRSP